MRVLSMLPILFASACGGVGSDTVRDAVLDAVRDAVRDTVPIAVVGDGEDGVVLQHQVVAVAAGAPAVDRATEAGQWAELRRQIGGGLLASNWPSNWPIDWSQQQMLLVVLPAAKELTGIVVSSEEGVDVITLDVAAVVSAKATAATACVLRLGRRPCQLAVVVRDQQAGDEQTVAMFAGS